MNSWDKEKLSILVQDESIWKPYRCQIIYRKKDIINPNNRMAVVREDQWHS